MAVPKSSTASLPPLRILLAILVLSLLAPAQVPGGKPGETHEQLEAFLRTAKVADVEHIPLGITKPLKLTLSDGNISRHAVFKCIDQRKPGITHLQTGVEIDFKDSWMFEIAAYEIDKLLGLNMVPPTVERTIRGEKGSVQLWVEYTFSELDRTRQGKHPPDAMAWDQQIWKVRVFDNLIYNIDRINISNLLITPDWKVCMIDHSRSFKTTDDLRYAKDLTHFSVSLMSALEGLTKADLKKCCARYLSGFEMAALLKRRDKIIELCKMLTKEHGSSLTYP